jgi:RimJ/RimL family protein N-acetyltransferase
MDALALIRQHLVLECIGFDPTGDPSTGSELALNVVKGQALVRIPGPEPDDLPRLYVIRHAGGAAMFFRADLPGAIRQRLRSLTLGQCFTEPERVLAILAGHAACESFHIGLSKGGFLRVEQWPDSPMSFCLWQFPHRPEKTRPYYVFPDRLPLDLSTAAVRLDASHAPFVSRFDPGIILAGRPVYGSIADGELASMCMSSREDGRSGEAWVYTRPAYRGRGYAAVATLAWAQALQAQGKVPFYSHKLNNVASAAVARRLGLIQYVADAAYV